MPQRDPASKYLDPTFPLKQSARDYIEEKRTTGKAMTGDDFFGKVHMQAAMRDIKSENKKRADNLASPKSYSKGGMVRKSGFAKVHKGEKVLTRKQVHKSGPRKRA